MKSNLALLIEHFEKEKIRLEIELKESIELWDFEIAESIKRPLQFVTDKLRILKNLENPYCDKIERLEESLSLSFDIGQYPEDMFPNSEYRQVWIKREAERERQNKVRTKEELEILKSIKIRDIVDSDILLDHLDKFRRNTISKIGFEILDTKLTLLLSKVDGQVFLNLVSNNNREVDDYLHCENLQQLKSLGFNPINYTKELLDFEMISDMSLLQNIALIMYDVFSSYGDQTIEVHVKSERLK